MIDEIEIISDVTRVCLSRGVRGLTAVIQQRILISPGYHKLYHYVFSVHLMSSQAAGAVSVLKLQELLSQC